MRAKEVSQLLARNAESVCAHYLDKGKKKGKEWVVGDINNTPGSSTSVCLSGPKAGTWKDFGNRGGSGDLLDLISENLNISILEAMKEGLKFLGIQDQAQIKPVVENKYTRPEPIKSLNNDFPEFAGRLIKSETYDAFKTQRDRDCIVFNYYRDDELIFWKKRSVVDKKKIFTSGNTEPCLYGWQAIPQDARTVVICEGEFDALSWWQSGQPALSVPFGCTNHQWIETDYDHLERFDIIYLSMDMDESGQSAIPEIVSRLGQERVMLVELPKKDANECLQADIDLLQFLNSAKSMDPPEFRSISDLRDEAFKELYPEPDKQGVRSPWNKLDDRLLFKPGDFVIMAGYNNAGKSTAINHIIIHMIHQGWKACLGSFEYSTRKYLSLLSIPLTQTPSPIKEHYDAVMDWLSGKVWVLERKKTPGTKFKDRLIELISYAVKKHGVNVFLIDNLTKLEIGAEDYTGQQEYCNLLADLAIELNVCIILVHHMRKGDRERREASIDDVKGTGGITDIAHTILLYKKNFKKAKGLAKEPDNQELLDQPDAYCYVEKQKNSNVPNKQDYRVALWWHKSYQCLEYKGIKPFTYVHFTKLKPVEVEI